MGLENDEPTGNIDGIDVDSLMSEIESPSSAEIPMTAPTETAPAQATTPEQTQAASQAAQEYAFKYNGKEIKAPIDKLTQWASQGYDYAQKMEQFNKQRQEYEQKQALIKQLEDRYSPVDEYVRQNPEWWDHVQQTWQQKQSPQDPVLSKVQEILQSKLGPVEEFIQSQQIKEQTQQREAEDSQLDTEIGSIRKQYSNLDFDTPDESGKSLEYKVLEHATLNGIKSFKTAFIDFNHERLMKIAEERGKESLNKDIQKRTKLGLLGSTPTPKKGIQPAENVKNKSYDQIHRETLDELGIA